MRPEALEAFSEAAVQVGNPSSLHTAGRSAKLRVEDARDTIAAAAGAHPSEIIFTAGGTESDNLALKGLYWSRNQDPATPRRRIVLTGIEHHAILDTAEWLETHEAAELDFVPVDSRGRVDVAAWEEAITRDPDTVALATMMWANNEVGTVQPIHELAALCAKNQVPFHTDAVQAFGAVPVNFADSGATTMAISGHKIGAPVGIGALAVRRDATLIPVLHGGGQERDIRSGTIAAPLILSFAAACAAVSNDQQHTIEAEAKLRDELIDGIRVQVPQALLMGDEDRDPETGIELAPGTRRLPGNVNFSFPGCEGDSLLFGLDMAGVESSTGSACTAGVSRPSHVLMAMGFDEDVARSTQRFTLGHTTVPEDVEKVLDVIGGVYRAASNAGMAGHDSHIKTANSHRPKN